MTTNQTWIAIPLEGDFNYNTKSLYQWNSGVHLAHHPSGVYIMMMRGYDSQSEGVAIQKAIEKATPRSITQISPMLLHWCNQIWGSYKYMRVIYDPRGSERARGMYLVNVQNDSRCYLLMEEYTLNLLLGKVRNTRLIRGVESTVVKLD